MTTGTAVSLVESEELLCDLDLPLCNHPPTHSPINLLSYLEVWWGADVASFEAPPSVATWRVRVVPSGIGGDPCTDLPAGGPVSDDCLDGTEFMEDSTPSVGRPRASGTSSSSASVSEVFRD